jgi:hypothetical protein
LETAAPATTTVPEAKAECDITANGRLRVDVPVGGELHHSVTLSTATRSITLEPADEARLRVRVLAPLEMQGTAQVLGGIALQRDTEVHGHGRLPRNTWIEALRADQGKSATAVVAVGIDAGLDWGFRVRVPVSCTDLGSPQGPRAGARPAAPMGAFLVAEGPLALAPQAGAAADLELVPAGSALLFQQWQTRGAFTAVRTVWDGGLALQGWAPSERFRSATETEARKLNAPGEWATVGSLIPPLTGAYRGTARISAGTEVRLAPGRPAWARTTEVINAEVILVSASDDHVALLSVAGFEDSSFATTTARSPSEGPVPGWMLQAWVPRSSTAW